MSNFIIRLLPQSSDTKIKDEKHAHDIMKCIINLLEISECAIRSFFVNKDYLTLDPHVGESACQIRAYYNYLLSFTDFNVNKYSEVVTVIKFKIYNIMSFNYCTIANYKHLNLGCFLTELIGANTLLDENIIEYITKSYVLTKFKVNNVEGNSFIDYDAVSIAFNITRKAAKKLVHEYQKTIARISCQFIINLVNKVHNCGYLKDLINYFQLSDNDNRQILPCYQTMQILIENMINSNCPVLLVVHRKYEVVFDVVPILFEPNIESFEYLYNSNKEVLNYKRSIIIHAEVLYPSYMRETREAYIKRIKDFGIVELILSYMANHSQYPGTYSNIQIKDPFNLIPANKNINHILRNEKEIFDMRKFNAELYGCTKDNKYLCFIKHIFMDTIHNQLQHIERNANYLYQCKQYSRTSEAVYNV